MALLQAQELDRSEQREPRFAVFATTSTHAPFNPIAPFVTDWASLTRPDAYAPAEASATQTGSALLRQPLTQYLASMRYQYAWISEYLQYWAPRPMVVVIVGDHQPPALVSGQGASWDVPVHVISDDPALLQRLLGSRFVPGLTPPTQALGSMSALTSVLLEVFDAPGHHETLGIEHVGRTQDQNTTPGQSVPGGS
jgi:hypothetical protein